ncbi:RGCVC family protein [Saccharothrix sp. BKS2]|uniref:RGCVC family protein n=1 Tax=Saccharothrix sp. BKS2 TaxID=3064400 RepID=UPI0039EB5638
MSTTEFLIDPLAPDTERRAEQSCPVCPHPADTHDSLSRRFCAATGAGELRRGCLCPGGSSSATYGRSDAGNISHRA